MTQGCRHFSCFQEVGVSFFHFCHHSWSHALMKSSLFNRKKTESLSIGLIPQLRAGEFMAEKDMFRIMKVDGGDFQSL